MKQRFSYLVSIVLLGAFALSCQPHKPFCYSHPHGAKVRVEVDWSEFKEDQPDGMTVTLFPTEATSQPTQQLTHTTTHADFEVMADKYMVMVHNQAASEFAAVRFQGMNSYETALVQPERCSSSWYQPVDNEILVRNPEWLAFDTKEAVVTEDMVQEALENEDYDYDDAHETVIATTTPQNIVHTIHISVRVRGINNFKSGLAAFSGLADGYFIGRNEYSSDKVTHMAETWTATHETTDADGVQSGVLASEITCFGLPSGHMGTADENILRLSMLLVDNKTRINRMFNVGDRIYQQDTDGSPLHLYLDLELPEQLPDVEPENASNENGFDATVDDWGEEKNEDIIM